jgi:superfamily I DNA/RNA helicase
MLTADQLTVVEAPVTNKIFLRGPAGSGKTTCGVERIKFLVGNGIPTESILLLTPQRTLQESYLNSLQTSEGEAGGVLTPATIGGLARRMVDLFWPLVVEVAGFSLTDQPPIFLTLETAQYYMARIVRPKMEEGFFESVVMDRNRLYSQIIDNLNKSASIGFPHTEIGERLASAWSGDPTQRRVYADTQACASEFRALCLSHNLLDFSLQLEVFTKLYWNETILKGYLQQTFQHIIYDNMEEDIPVTHDLIHDWLPSLDSALLIYDDDAGYRQFLGADPSSALNLSTACERTISLQESFVSDEELLYLSSELSNVMNPGSNSVRPLRQKIGETTRIISTRFYPEMLDEIASEILNLINNGTRPSEIVVLAPYLSDALRFSLSNRLEAYSIASRSLRPSRSLRDEPTCQCLLTLAELAHPQWGFRPAKYDVVRAFLQSLEGMDLVRAQLLTEVVYRSRDLSLGSFDRINSEMQERITYLLGNRYETLRLWLESYIQEGPQPLDHFLRRLFGEVLSQTGFKFHRDIDAARVTSSLIESVQKFRIALSQGEGNEIDSAKDYIAMLQEGVISSQYVSAWAENTDEAVLISPAYTFLMSNRPVTIQFWLDVGSSGWYERLFQPLTHPYVLSRNWQPGHIWTDADEVAANNSTLARLTTGLLRRCRERIYLCISELGESGYEQRGVLLRAFNQVLTQNNP